MPSRRAVLTALASVTAGCSIGPATPSDGEEPTVSPNPSPSVSPSATDQMTVGFDPVSTDEIPSEELILVVSPTWREWLRQAANGTTVRGAADPPDCGRAPLDDVSAVRLRDTPAAGDYELDLEDGGYYEYRFDAAQAEPPATVTVYDLAALPSAVATRLGELIDTGGGRLVPQGETFQFVDDHSEPSDEYSFLLYVHRNETVYRVFARVPTLTPPCGFYVVFSLTPSESIPEATTLSLASMNAPEALQAAARTDQRYALTTFAPGARTRLRQFDYLLGLTQSYRVVRYR